MSEIDVFNITRRRFRYDQSVNSERANLTNKQRVYKQILDEQVEQKRRIQQRHRSQQIQERAGYAQPSELYQPRIMYIKDTPRHSISGFSSEKEQLGVSRFITEPPQPGSKLHQRKNKNKEDDQQINGYVQQCEKILTSLKGLAVSSINKPTVGDSSSRKFIKLNRDRQLLVKSNIESMEKKFTQQYGNDNSKLPTLRKMDIVLLKNKRDKDSMAIIINPILYNCSKFEDDEGRSKTKRQPLVKAPTRDLLTSLNREDLDHIHTVKLMSSRTNSRNSLVEEMQDKPKDVPPLQLNPEKEQIREQPEKSINNLSVKLAHPSQVEEKLAERSRKTQQDINKERFRKLARNSSPQEKLDSPIKFSSLSKSGKKVMVHLVRAKAHGQKLFERIKHYNRSMTEQKQHPISSAAKG